MTEPRLREVEQVEPDLAIGDAAIDVLRALAPAQLLSAITPEHIGERTGYSASSVRYRLNAAAKSRAPRRDGGASPPTARGWSFDREQLLLSAIHAHRARTREALTVARERYAIAMEALKEGDVLPLERALEADVDSVEAGGTGVVMSSERVHLLALAACDGSPEIARALHALDEDRRESFRALIEQSLAAIGREPRGSHDADALSDTVAHYLSGLAARRRFDPSADRGRVLTTVVAIALGFTQPLGEATTGDGPLGDLLRGFGR